MRQKLTPSQRRYGARQAMLRRAKQRQAIAQNRRTSACLRCAATFEFVPTAVYAEAPPYCVSCLAQVSVFRRKSDQENVDTAREGE